MTTSQRPLIFISNDDGVTSEGINALIEFMRPLGDLIVMAPDSPRSGFSCALSVNNPVHYYMVRQEPGLEVYACTGTPMDCIKLARYTVLSRKPDLVVAGINHGNNSGTNVHYSGTMGVVIEGCLNGIPSIGFSHVSHAHHLDFSPCGDYIRSIAQMVLDEGLPPHVCLNVNFPDLPAYKGVKICRQAMGEWVNEWEGCPRHRDANYFWLAGEFQAAEPENPYTDYYALHHGYVAITPTTVDMTAEAFYNTLIQRFQP